MGKRVAENRVGSLSNLPKKKIEVTPCYNRISIDFSMKTDQSLKIGISVFSCLENLRREAHL